MWYNGTQSQAPHANLSGSWTLIIRNEFIPILVVGLILLVLIAAGVEGLPAPLPMLRLVLGLGFVLLVPGYALQAALFPRRDELDGAERLGLSFGLSVAVIPPIILLLEALPWGIRLWPIVLSEALFMTLCSVLALHRRGRLPHSDRVGLELEIDLRGWWAAQDRIQRLLLGMVGLALVGTAIATTAIVSTPRPDDRLTEFYVLGSEGLAESYPRHAVLGQPVTVTMGIANHEGAVGTYRVEIHCGGDLIGQVGPIDLEAGEIEERPLTFVPGQVGTDVKVEFWLFRDSGLEPYRSLHLWIDVTEEGTIE